METKKKVDAYIARHTQWQEALQLFRGILLEAGLEETVKWGGPVYTLGGKNIVGIGAFKSYVGMWFHQGALLSDPAGILVNAGEGKTRALRQMRFTDTSNIDAALIKKYVLEAIANHKAGKEIKPLKQKPLELPEELREIFASDAALSDAFEALTLTKKREYAEYISEAKREATRQKRLEKILPMIRSGQGLNDKYRK